MNRFLKQMAEANSHIELDKLSDDDLDIYYILVSNAKQSASIQQQIREDNKIKIEE